MDVVRQKVTRGKGQAELMSSEHVSCRQLAIESIVDVSDSVRKLMLSCRKGNQLPYNDNASPISKTDEKTSSLLQVGCGNQKFS